MANARQVCQAGRNLLKGIVPSEGYQRRMGGLYRVGESGTRADAGACRAIESPLETSYNRQVWPRSGTERR